LRRLETAWIEPPISFVTTCAGDRRPLFAQPKTASILIGELRGARARHGWRVGRFVIMPDHRHVFCTHDESSGGVPRSRFIGSFKEWTAKRLTATGVEGPIGQKQLFDRLLRSPRAMTTNGPMSDRTRFGRGWRRKSRIGRSPMKSRRSTCETRSPPWDDAARAKRRCRRPRLQALWPRTLSAADAANGGVYNRAPIAFRRGSP